MSTPFHTHTFPRTHIVPNFDLGCSPAPIRCGCRGTEFVYYGRTQLVQRDAVFRLVQTEIVLRQLQRQVVQSKMVFGVMPINHSIYQDFPNPPDLQQQQRLTMPRMTSNLSMSAGVKGLDPPPFMSSPLVVILLCAAVTSMRGSGSCPRKRTSPPSLYLYKKRMNTLCLRYHLVKLLKKLLRPVRGWGSVIGAVVRTLVVHSCICSQYGKAITIRSLSL